MSVTTVVVEPAPRRLSELMNRSGVSVAASIAVQDGATSGIAAAPDVIVADLRGETSIPTVLSGLRRQYPRTGVVIVVSSMDPQLLLEAMRAGINECVPEPFTPEDLRAAIERITGTQLTAADSSQVLAFVGAKGGVGTTTLAVNAATALTAGSPGHVAIVDLHLGGHGDVALLMGVEPRFSVADALDNTERLDSAYLKTLLARAKVGVDVLASPDRPLLKTPDPERIHVLLTRLTERYSTVVLDVPRDGFGLLDSLDPLTSVTLVVNQELPTIRRAAQIGTLLRQRYGKERVATVVSRYDSRADIGQEDIEEAVGLPVLAALPSDYRKVLAAANAGRPLVSENHTRLASSIEEFARRLASKGDAKEKKTAKPKSRLGFF